MKTYKKVTVTSNTNKKPFRVFRMNKHVLFIETGILQDTDNLFLTDLRGFRYERNLSLEYIGNNINMYFVQI